MRNLFQDDPDYYDYITNIIVAGRIKAEDLARMMLLTHLGAYARLMGIDTRGKREGAIAQEVVAGMRSGRSVAQPPIDSGTANQNPNAPICDGCGGVSKLKRITRWEKALKGEPVSISFDLENMPEIPGLDINDMAMQAQFWADLTQGVLQLAFLPLGKVGDVHVTFKDLPDSILGMTLQPRNKKASMESAGMAAGDITIDSIRAWTTQLFLLTLRHEFAHAFGAPHSDNPLDIIYFQPTIYNMRGAGPGDIAWAGDAYPLEIAA